MKNLLTTLAFLLIPSVMLAQNAGKKGEIIIHIEGYTSVNYRFYIDIYKKNKSAKIIYRYRDSIKFAESRKDAAFGLLRNRQSKYASDDPRRTAMSDSVGMFFEKHSAYTQDSTIVNLKTDTSFSNLLQRFANATKEDLEPPIKRNWLDGYSILSEIVTEDKTFNAYSDTPHAQTHPLLFEFIKGVLNKNKNSAAVSKILKNYSDFN